MTGQYKVLFLCTGNSRRSQMAEAIVNARLDSGWFALSAGTKPADQVHPLALKVLEEIGISHKGLVKPASAVLDVKFDLVVTVCDSAAEECPLWLTGGKVVHLPFQDPAKAAGSRDQVMAVFRWVRDEIAAQVPELLKRFLEENCSAD